MHTPDRDAGLLEGTVAGSWGLGIVEQPQGELGLTAVDCGEMDRGDMREEIVEGNDCAGKPGTMEVRRYC